MRRRKWVWIGVAVVLVVVLCAAALMFPATPYRFLRGAQLQDFVISHAPTVSTSYPGTPPVSFTVRSYASQMEFGDLADKARNELQPLGFVETRFAWTGEWAPPMIWFEKGTEKITLTQIPSMPPALHGIPSKWAYLVGRAKTYIEVTTETTWLDRLQAKLHPKRGGP